MKPILHIRNLGETIDRFNKGCSSYQQAIKTWQKGEFSDSYEKNALLDATIKVVGALEGALKIYLRNACRGKEDFPKLKHPEFHDLVTLMEKYAKPDLPPEIIRQLYDYRDMRNLAEHDMAAPSREYLGEAIKMIRQIILTYLHLEEDHLNMVSGAKEMSEAEKRNTEEKKSRSATPTHSPTSGNVHEEAERVKRLINKYARRLQKLKEQQALLGSDTPPAILIEIEDIEAEIEKLELELKEIESGITPALHRNVPVLSDVHPKLERVIESDLEIEEHAGRLTNIDIEDAETLRESGVSKIDARTKIKQTKEGSVTSGVRFGRIGGRNVSPEKQDEPKTK